MKKILFVFLFMIALLVSVDSVRASSTRVKGHQSDRYDQDGNGTSDAGVYVNGHYTSLFAYEGEYGPGDYPAEDWYWDLGDGRIYGTVTTVDELDEETLTVCDYVVNYRADFGNDPFMDQGWIQNHINCTGYDDNGHYNYLIVSEDDPRYTGNPDWAVWGNWEYVNYTQDHQGNLVKVTRHLVE